MSDVVVTSLNNLQSEVSYGEGRTFITDEPLDAGGDGAGGDPYSLILGALGSCISMTVRLYARRKGWPLERVTVRLRQKRMHAQDCKECERSTEGYVHHIERAVTFEGNLSDEQLERLREIAYKCPVHRTLSSEIVITDLKDPDAAP
ncbi:MAG: OsmC family protein [bacterium]